MEKKMEGRGGEEKEGATGEELAGRGGPGDRVEAVMISPHHRWFQGTCPLTRV